VDISNATERRHSPEIAAHAQKHKQRNLEKPATGVQDKPATNGQIKEDTVEISEEGRAAASRLIEITTPIQGFDNEEQRAERDQVREQWQLRVQQREAETAESNRQSIVQDTSSAEHFIFNALSGKVENALDIAVELGNMVFASAWETLGGRPWNPDTDLETRVANREAGRDLAKYIAENYFDDPKEAQAFMDKINKYIKNSELRDQGYVAWCAEMEPVKPNPPSAELLFAQKLGYDISKCATLGGSAFELFGNETDYKNFRDKYFAYEMERNAKNPNQEKVLRDPTWEDWKETLSDPKYCKDSEQYKTWYSDFLKKINSTQNMINNAKLMITDFSSNQKWNVVMNLLR
jgi:hypothetical protein